MPLLLNARSAEKTFSVTEKSHAVSVPVNVLQKGGFAMNEKILEYKVSLAVFRNFLKMGLLTEEEYGQAEQILAEKCGLSLCSIFREIP